MAISSVLTRLARDLSGDPLTSSIASAYIRVISQLPLYFAQDEIFPVQGDEAKYLAGMAVLEISLKGFQVDPKSNTQLLIEFSNWSKELMLSNGNSSIALTKVLRYYTCNYFWRGTANPLSTLMIMSRIISRIIRHPPGKERTLMIAEFDKWMRNLIIVGREAALKYTNPSSKKTTPRIPDADKYYNVSIGNPMFDITRFLTNGPYTMFFYCSDGFKYIDQLDSMFNVQLDQKYATFEDIPYSHLVSSHHRWNKISKEEREENFKIMFPEPVNVTEALHIPF